MDRIFLILIAIFAIYFFMAKETFIETDRNKQVDIIKREQTDRYHKLIFG
jgi:hypothetical protein